MIIVLFFFFKQKTAYEMRISDWSSDVCSSDLATKLVKGYLGTNNIDTNSRLCMSSAVSAYTKTLGEDAVPVTYEDIDQADCFLVAGANTAWRPPIIFRRVDARLQAKPEARMVVVRSERSRVGKSGVVSENH